MARNSARSSNQIAAAVKKASTSASAPCTGLRAVMTASPVSNIVVVLTEPGVGRPVPGYLLLVAVADREQHRLGVVEVPPLLAVVLENARLDDGVDRAGLLAEAAEDALRQVDVVARGAPRGVLPLL